MSGTREALVGIGTAGGFAAVSYAALYYLLGHNFQTPWGAIEHVADGTATHETYNTLGIEGALVLSILLIAAGSRGKRA